MLHLIKKSHISTISKAILKVLFLIDNEANTKIFDTIKSTLHGFLRKTKSTCPHIKQKQNDSLLKKKKRDGFKKYFHFPTEVRILKNKKERKVWGEK